MKKISIILVMLFWCNVSVAEVFKFDCKTQGKNGADQEYYRMTLDTDNKTTFHEWKFKNDSAKSAYGIVTSLNGTKVKYKYDDPDWGTYEFDYSSNPFIDYGTAPRGNTTTKCISKTEERKIEIASMIDKAKATCKDLGFKEGTEKFSDCSLKLYSQSVELAAKSNQTVVMQPQSSGSSSMTIYDPVRDNRALMRQGQRMLSGRCTLGIDC